LGAFILSAKVWEDESVWNVDFLNCFPKVTKDEMYRLETYFLNGLQFSVSLKASEYAQYYLELRGLSELDSHALEPLDEMGAALLEEKSLKRELWFKETLMNPTQKIKMKRTSSINQYLKKAPKVTLQ